MAAARAVLCISAMSAAGRRGAPSLSGARAQRRPSGHEQSDSPERALRQQPIALPAAPTALWRSQPLTMASFLVRGGATTAKKSPPFAIDDPTAPMHGDFTGKHGAAAAGAERPPAPRLIRGYAGFVPNIKEVAGASYSKCADRALTTEVVELLSSDSLPADPQSAVHSAGTRAKPNEVTAAMTATKHIPGYTGHVTGVKHA